MRYDGTVRQASSNHPIPSRGFHSNCARPAHGAFTLVELLITMALLIVMSVLLWGFGSPSHQQQQKIRCSANLQKIHLALEIYSKDCGGDFPFIPQAQTSAEALNVLVPKYTVDTASFVCPGSQDKAISAGEPIRGRKISYAYYMGRRLADQNEPLMSDKQVNTQAKKTNDVLFSMNGKPPGNNHHKFGGNILFVGGQVETVKPRTPLALKMSPSVVLLNP